MIFKSRLLTRWHRAVSWIPRVKGLLLLVAASACAQDIQINTFEATTYGAWTTTGTAFGSGPALGTLPGQNPVTGYQGSRLVNTFLGGDASTGTLTSLPFTIQRNYIRFLIGGGNQRGKTCMNLIVNGQIVRSAVGLGDREELTALQWNVGNLINSNATIQIVDTATGGWGHINVDQIIQTDASLGSVVTITNRYLNLPVKTGATKRLFELVVDGLVTHEAFIELADSVTPDFYSFLDLGDFQGKQALVRVDSAAANPTSLNSLVWSNGIVGANTFYQEANRPIYHFTARRGWLNDPNGLVYFNGEYHMGYQHNPYGWNWANMHWGHAVSTDLVHWTELPEWLYPDPLGAMWSGSAVVDWNNSAGFGTNALVAFYTGAAKGSDPNLPRMANAGQFTQCMAYSLDSGRTLTKYTNNPVVPNLGGDNRDPKVFWYAPGNKWVMLLWVDGNEYRFFSSPNLKNWTQTSSFTFPGVIEVPDIFELPLDGNATDKKWIFWGGAGNYYIGTFDGNAFTAQSGPFTVRGGDCFAATQTFNDVPGGRRILIVHGTIQFPGMPFNNNINFPMDLTLRTSPSGARLYANPVPELALLRTSTNTWPTQALVSGSNILSGTTGEAFELDATFQPGTATSVTFTLRGTTVTYNRAAQTVTCSGTTQSLAPSNGVVRLQMLADRGIIEIFGNDGLLYMPMRVTPSAGAQAVSLVANGSGATLNSLTKHDLGSAWNFSYVPPPPTIAVQPAPLTVNLGGPAAFNVTAAGVGPFAYQWRNNGQPIPGATNSTLSIFPASGTNLNYDVVVTNAGGAVTSSVAPLTRRSPYKVSLWRMESQVLTPNTAGTPTFNGVLDAQTASGLGIVAVGGVVPAARDDLITFNSLSNGPVALSNSVPPASMFVNGNTGGTNSFNAGAYSVGDGALFFPQDVYGNEFSFNSPFSIELFFKTHGNKSAAGRMQLVMQGEGAFRYGIVLNDTIPGSVKFIVTNQTSMQAVAALTNTNYADGGWRYLLAVYDTLAGTNGQLRLTVVNTNGGEATAVAELPAGFGALPASNDGNLFLGRFKYPIAQEHRTFLGLIDEVQITAGVVSNSWRLGNIPSVDNAVQFTTLSNTSGSLSMQWTSGFAQNYEVQWIARLGDVWETIAIVPSAGLETSFTDTKLARLTQPSGFYRILRQ